MKFWLRSICIALSTYSAIPMPRCEWDEKSMHGAICFLPLVGVFCGAGLYAWHFVCAKLALPQALFAAVATVLPLAVTGGIHMDGFMDTSDALASHQPRERKLEIMKDSHCGAFAALRCCMYLLLSFGFHCAIFCTAAINAVCIGFVLSRALSALAAVTLPNARGGGMLASFTEHAAKHTAAAIMCMVAIAAAAAMILTAGIPGACCAIAAIASLIWYRTLAMREFGGVTGDTSGYFLQCCELAMLIGAFVGTLL